MDLVPKCATPRWALRGALRRAESAEDVDALLDEAALLSPSAPRQLSLADNALTVFPAVLLQSPPFRRLQELVLDDNRISALPDGLGALCHLKVLSVQRNRLSGALPAAVAALAALEELRVSGNAALTSLPPELAGAPRLRRVLAVDTPSLRVDAILRGHERIHVQVEDEAVTDVWNGLLLGPDDVGARGELLDAARASHVVTVGADRRAAPPRPRDAAGGCWHHARVPADGDLEALAAALDAASAFVADALAAGGRVYVGSGGPGAAGAAVAMATLMRAQATLDCVTAQHFVLERRPSAHPADCVLMALRAFSKVLSTRQFLAGGHRPAPASSSAEHAAAAAEYRHWLGGAGSDSSDGEGNAGEGEGEGEGDGDGDGDASSDDCSVAFSLTPSTLDPGPSVSEAAGPAAPRPRAPRGPRTPRSVAVAEQVAREGPRYSPVVTTRLARVGSFGSEMYSPRSRGSAPRASPSPSPRGSGSGSASASPRWPRQARPQDTWLSAPPPPGGRRTSTS